MKKLLSIFVLSISFFGCDQDQVTIEDLNSSSANNSDTSLLVGGVSAEKFNTIGADRCGDTTEMANFWWPEDKVSPRILSENFYISPNRNPLTYVVYNDGTAHVSGTTSITTGQECTVNVDLWLKNRKSWDEWSAEGGEFKEEGCSEAIAENQYYYIVDDEKSSIKSSGSDCIGEGKYGLEQRPDPNDPDTPNFGVVIGPGGALWDSNVGENGLAGWVWITDINTNERLWIADFNFLIGDKIEKVKECLTIGADRCGNTTDTANFWWPEEQISPRILSKDFYESATDTPLIFTEFEDGTVNVKGTTMGTTGINCLIKVNLWLKEKKTWTEWQAIGGEFKDEGCSEAIAEEQIYYIIDSEKSSITSTGGDCLGEGTYGLEQRPDPNDLDTPSFGVVVGPGGALWDSNVDANGLAGWAWITDKCTGERLWISDFNFLIECQDLKEE